MRGNRASALAATALLVSIAAFASRFDAGDFGSRRDHATPAITPHAAVSPAVAQQIPIASADTPYFQEVVGAIPDLKPIYDQYVKPVVVQMVPIDLNADGLDDLLLHLWVFNFGGPANNDPCQNRLIALIYKPGGTFVDETATRISGTTDIQGCSRHEAVLDLNADGRQDVVFAVSQEDGRNWTDAETQLIALNAALVSRPDGQYAIERYGNALMHAGISLPRAEDGNALVATSSYSGGGLTDVFRRAANGTWEPVNAGLPTMHANFSQFYRDDGTEGPSDRLIKTATAPNNFDLGGALRDALGQWHELPDLRFFEYPGTVIVHSWAGGYGSTPVVRIGDEYAATGSFNRECEFRFFPGGPLSVVTRMQVGMMPVPYSGPTQVVEEGSLISVSLLRGFRVVDGALAVVPLNIAGDRTREVNTNIHRCQDVNADGYDDVVVYDYGAAGIPDVYVNNRKGGLRNIGTAAFPVPPVDWGGQGTSLLHDFDHDGKVDYLSCPCNAVSSNFGNDVSYHFYKGIDVLPSESVPADPIGARAQGAMGAAIVDFSAPRDDGGLPITGYTVQSIPVGGVDSQAGSLAHEHLITGLTNGTSYKFVVVAHNAKGTSNPSLQSNAVTPLPHLISVAAASASEGNSGTSVLNFTVSLSAPAGHPVSVDLATANGLAAAGSDYEPVSVPGLVIPAGQTSVIVPVIVNGDLEVEWSETFTINLSNPVGANFAGAQAVGRIVNDDLPILSLADASIQEGNTGQQSMSFRLTLARAIDTPVRFDIATSSGTAIGGSDFVTRSLSNRLLDAGRTSAVFEVAIMGDQQAETNEVFGVLVSNVQGAIAGDVQAVGTIQNDDGGGAAKPAGGRRPMHAKEIRN